MWTATILYVVSRLDALTAVSTFIDGLFPTPVFYAGAFVAVAGNAVLFCQKLMTPLRRQQQSETASGRTGLPLATYLHQQEYGLTGRLLPPLWWHSPLYRRIGRCESFSLDRSGRHGTRRHTVTNSPWRPNSPAITGLRSPHWPSSARQQSVSHNNPHRRCPARPETRLPRREERIRLALALTMALPGTPVLLYGDEIGMGEDLSLPGRLAVRNPMQWSPGQAGGFSAGDKPYRPVHADGPYGYARSTWPTSAMSQVRCTPGWPRPSGCAAVARNSAGRVAHTRRR